MSAFRRDLSPFAIILGTNEIASAVAVHLRRAGWSIVLSHDPLLPVIRRAMAFHDALFDDRPTVEEIRGERVETAREIADTIDAPNRVAVPICSHSARPLFSSTRVCTSITSYPTCATWPE